MKIIITSILLYFISCTVTLGDSKDLDIFIHELDFITGGKEYLISGGELKVVYGFSKMAEIKYSRMLSSDEISSLISFLEKCQLANLKESYTNPAVEDGYQVSFKIKLKGTEFHIGIANVYQPTMVSICEKINELLPTEYHIWVPSKTSGIIIID